FKGAIGDPTMLLQHRNRLDEDFVERHNRSSVCEIAPRGTSTAVYHTRTLAWAPLVCYLSLHRHVQDTGSSPVLDTAIARRSTIAAAEATYYSNEMAQRVVEWRSYKRTAMPSPFPGMDPYLEGSEWSSVHVALSAEMARQLAPKVQPKYIVRTARRFVTDMPEDIAVTAGDLYPDVSVAEAAAPQGRGLPPAMIAPAPLQMATVIPSRVPHVTIEIRDIAQRELVTAIEILSPTNKRGEVYREYLDKRR